MSLINRPTSADSPFLPGTNIQFAWDSVSLGAALACWRRYQLSVLQGWQPRGEQVRIALDFGLSFHKAQEIYHTLRLTLDHEEAVPATVRELLNYRHYQLLPIHEEVAMLKTEQDDEDDGITFRNTKVRTRYHLIRSLVWYWEHYANDYLKTYTLPQTGAAAVELSFRLALPLEVGGVPAILSGHIDRVADWHDNLWLTDYKTTKSLSRQFFASFALSHQFSGYIFAGQNIFDQPITGAFIDGIALLVGSATFRRAPINRSPGQIHEYLETFQLVLDQAERLDETHRNQDYPMNPAACYFCEYKTVCGTDPAYRKSILHQHFEQKKSWNPLENR